MCLAVLFGGVGVPATAGPAEEELGDLAGPLGEPVSVDLIGTPLARALETLGRDTGLNILISPQFSASLSGRSITLTIDGLPATKALNLIGIATETDWFIREGVVLVAPEDYVRSLRVQTRVYDIRELLESAPNYLGPDLSIDGTLSNTNSGGSGVRQSESYNSGGSSGGGLFGDDRNDLGDDTPSRDELVDGVTDLIINTVADPDEWLDGESTVTEFNGSLIVQSTPEVLDEVGELLVRLSAAGGRMVVAEGQFFVVPRAMVDALDGGLVLDAEGYRDLSARLRGDGDANIRRIASGRTVCFNGQRVYVYAGGERALLTDLEPIPDAAGVDPTLSTAHNGAVFDLKPTITLDGGHISVAVRTEAVDRSGMGATPVPVGSAESGDRRVQLDGSLNGNADSRSGSEHDATLTGHIGQRGKVEGEPQSHLTGTAELGLPEQDILTLRTNVRVPDGGAVVLSGVTGQYADIDAGELEVIFVLRLRIAE